MPSWARISAVGKVNSLVWSCFYGQVVPFKWDFLAKLALYFVCDSSPNDFATLELEDSMWTSIFPYRPHDLNSLSNGFGGIKGVRIRKTWIERLLRIMEKFPSSPYFHGDFFDRWAHRYMPSQGFRHVDNRDFFVTHSTSFCLTTLMYLFLHSG